METDGQFNSIIESVNLDLPQEGSIGILLSGGMNSALLAYLVAKGVKDNYLNTQVFLLTGEKLSLPFNLRYAQRVKKRVQELLNFTFDLHLTYIIPDHQKDFSSQQEAENNSFYLEEYSKRFKLQKIISGHTKSSGTLETGSFEFAKSHENSLIKPFQSLEKKHIALLFREFDLLNSLLPMTRSCEAGLDESDFFEKVCSEISLKKIACPNCLEQTLAFESLL